MKYACQYAIIRFMPFIETGEFANIGIVLMCPEINYFDFKILSRMRRITAFFDQLSGKIYRNSRKDLNAELTRFKNYADDLGGNNQKTLRFAFQELIRPREVMVRYDAPRTVLSANPATKLEDLFAHYVERDFVTPNYIERRLESQMRGVLQHANIRDRYEEARIEAGPISALFPFAHKNIAGHVDRVIKPIHLAHQDAALAYEHGWVWVGKLRQLAHADALPAHVLLATKTPENATTDQINVYRGLRHDFEELGVEVISIDDTRNIEHFALAVN